MAKRKRKPGERRGSKLRPIKDYRDDYFTLYIAQVETGILEAWTIEPDIRDGDVREALRKLIRDMKRTDELPAGLTADNEEKADDTSLLEWRILAGLQLAFERHGSLNVEDTIGILGVINSSVGTWNRGMRGQEYLKYIQGFLGGLGVSVRQVTQEEAEALLLDAPDETEPGASR